MSIDDESGCDGLHRSVVSVSERSAAVPAVGVWSETVETTAFRLKGLNCIRYASRLALLAGL